MWPKYVRSAVWIALLVRQSKHVTMFNRDTQNIDRYYKEPKFHTHTRQQAKLWCCLHFQLYGAQTLVKKWRSICQPSAEHSAFTSELLPDSVEPREFSGSYYYWGWRWPVLILLRSPSFSMFLTMILLTKNSILSPRHLKCDACLTVCRLQYALCAVIWRDPSGVCV